MVQDLRALMAPQSVAVVGATERAGASAGYVMTNLIRMGYGGRILPVHPRESAVFGHSAAPRLSDLDLVPDCVVVGIGAPNVAQVLEEAGAMGVKAAVVLASGFSEIGAEGAAREAEVKAVAARYDMALCGPNCLGLVNLGTGAALYSSTLSPNMKRGGLALVSASGASAIALGNSGQIGVSAVVSMGNAAVTGLADYLRWFAQDEATRVIGLVVEGISDPDAIAAAMEAVHAAGKSAIALRVGRSADGQRATAAHTGALAGATEAQTAFLARVGITDLPDLDAFLAAATLAERGARPKAGKLAVLGVSGGGIAHVADIASECGLAFADLSPETVARIGEKLPSFATPQNPLDLTGAAFGDAGLYATALDALDADPAVGMIVAAQDAPPGLSPEIAEEYLGIASAIAGYRGATPLVALANLSAGHHPLVAEAFGPAIRLNGTRSALTALSRLQGTSSCVTWRAADRGQALPDMANETAARAVFDAVGLSGPKGEIATTAEEAAILAERFGGKVVMKISSPDIHHKTEAGGVLLGIEGVEAARKGFTRIMSSAAAYAPTARLDGVLVQEMISGGVEALLGLVDHAPFGLGLVVGTGGTLAEILQDSAFDLLPIDAARADRMLAATKLDQLLAGARGAPPADRASLVTAMVALSDFGLRHAGRIEGIDLNPVAILPKGKGLRVLDALVIPK